MKSILVTLLVLMTSVPLHADYKPAAKVKQQKTQKAPVIVSHGYDPHAVQFAFPGYGLGAFGNPFLGYGYGLGAYGTYQQASPVVAVVDVDGVVRLIELRQLRGYQPAPVQLQYPLQLPSVPAQPKP